MGAANTRQIKKSVFGPSPKGRRLDTENPIQTLPLYKGASRATKNLDGRAASVILYGSGAADSGNRKDLLFPSGRDRFANDVTTYDVRVGFFSLSSVRFGYFGRLWAATAIMGVIVRISPICTVKGRKPTHFFGDKNILCPEKKVLGVGRRLT